MPTKVPCIHVLPPEVIATIFTFAVNDSPALCRVSQTFRHMAQRSLYRTLTIRDGRSMYLLVRTLSTPFSEHVVKHIRTLAIYASRIDWRIALALAALLKPVSNNITTLKVRFPASDLPLAIEVLQALSPVEFEWITSPCWLIRPAELFTRFLKGWTRLRTVRLGNFCYDSQFASCIAQLSTISHLTLLGRSNKNLDPEVLRVLLSHPIISRRLRVLEIGDCPVRRRDIIAKEIGLGQAPTEEVTSHVTTDFASPSSTLSIEDEDDDDERWLHACCFEDLFRPLRRPSLKEAPITTERAVLMPSSPPQRASKCPYLSALHQAAQLRSHGLLLAASDVEVIVDRHSPLHSANPIIASPISSSTSTLQTCAAGKAAASLRHFANSAPDRPALKQAKSRSLTDRRLDILRWVE